MRAALSCAGRWTEGAIWPGVARWAALPARASRHHLADRQHARAALGVRLLRAGAGREPHRTPQDPAQKRPHVLSFGVLSFGTGQSGQLILHTATYCLLWSVRRAIAQTRPLQPGRVRQPAAPSRRNSCPRHRDRHPHCVRGGLPGQGCLYRPSVNPHGRAIPTRQAPRQTIAIGPVTRNRNPTHSDARARRTAPPSTLSDHPIRCDFNGDGSA